MMSKTVDGLHCVYLSIGSNIDRQYNIRQCLTKLVEAFGEVQSSPVYESEPVGFRGECFFNLVVKIHTRLDLESLSGFLKNLEHEQGRIRNVERFSSRTMDIDILLYDELCGKVANIALPRPEVYYNAFVLLPLVDLAGNEIDPKSGRSFAKIWQEKGPEISKQQKLWQVEFDWPQLKRAD